MGAGSTYDQHPSFWTREKEADYLAHSLTNLTPDLLMFISLFLNHPIDLVLNPISMPRYFIDPGYRNVGYAEMLIKEARIRVDKTR